MSTLPDGVVTLLFSDVEGSTRLAKELGDTGWAELLEEHRRILRLAFSARAGREVDAPGDGFFVTFNRATDAVAAAVEGQRALEEHPWPGRRVRVRIGIHTGEALARGDYYAGHEVHRASRICDAGHGGQIVVSTTTADLVRERLPFGVTLTDLGQHRLKDLVDVERLFQLQATGLPSEFPRLRTLDIPHNLPAERSSFVGREKEITDTRKLLTEHRLVTLTGIGGSGKTRLALQVGAMELGGFQDGVFFVDLAPVSDPELVSQTLATACGLSFEGGLGDGGSAEDRFVASLSRWRCLLLVDNCEHLLDPVADLVERIHADCADVVLLVTSREALGVEGEQLVQVPSLAVPDDPSEIEAVEAVRLFTARAQSVRPTFQLGSDSRAPVVEICRRLDGIPLAIEFAAARVAHLSPQQIADRLDDRFRLLTGGRRRIQRQQTLEAALDWSHELLDEEERALFRRLAVFAGGFSLDAAEAVCAGDGLAARSVLDLLGSLVAKSLVTANDDLGETRYRLLETVRVYTSEKLVAAGEVETVRSRHRDWYLGWIEAMSLERLVFAPTALRATAGEIDNLRACADWCLGDDRPDLLARLTTRLFPFWWPWLGGFQGEGRRRLVAALKHEERLTTDERVACHAVVMMSAAGKVERNVEHATRAIDLASGQASPFLVVALVGRAFGNSVLAAHPGADARLAADARHDVEAAAAAARPVLAVEWRALAELFGAQIETILGDMRAAADWGTALVDSCGLVEHPGWLLPSALSGLVVSHHLLGENDEALRAAMQLRALPDLPRLLGRPLGLVYSAAVEVTPALVAGGQEDLACQLLRDAVRDVRRFGIPLVENQLLGMVGMVEQLRGSPRRAGRLLSAARHLGGAASLGMPFRSPATWALYRHYYPRILAELGPDEAHRARNEGRAMTLEDALAYALGGLG